VSGRNGFNVILDQSGTVMVTVSNEPDALLQVELVPTGTLAVAITPVSTQLPANVTA